jgi:hypothetical protein
MTGISTTFNPVNDLVVLIVFVGGVFAYARTRIPQQTIKNLQDLVASQTQSIAELKERGIEDAKAISKLEGQIAVYKELPLRELADGIKEVVKISKDNAISNQKILETLQSTAKINEEDRDVLTNQSKHIRDEVTKLMGKKK